MWISSGQRFSDCNREIYSLPDLEPYLQFITECVDGNRKPTNLFHDQTPSGMTDEDYRALLLADSQSHCTEELGKCSVKRTSGTVRASSTLATSCCATSLILGKIAEELKRLALYPNVMMRAEGKSVGRKSRNHETGALTPSSVAHQELSRFPPRP